MPRPIRPLLVALLSVCSFTPFRAADAPATHPTTRPTTATAGTPRTFALDREHGDFLLTVPPIWDYTVRYPVPGLPPSIEFSTGQGKRFALQVTPLWPPKNKPDAASPEGARQAAEARRKAMLPGAKETTVDLQEIKGDHATGYYFTLTDKQPKPGEFECMTTAAVYTDGLMVFATILHHAKDTPERTAALEALRTASRRPPAKDAAAADAPAFLRIPLPIAGTGATDLLLPAGNLQVAGQRFSAARRTTELMATDKDAGLTLSVFMEPAQKPGDATAVRSVYWGRMQQSPIPMKDVKLAKSGDLATVEYMVPDVNQKHLNVYAAKSGIWIDVHLSKINFTPADQALFTNLPTTLKFERAAK